MDEYEYLGWQLAEMLDDLEGDPDSWDHPMSSLQFVLYQFEDVDAELKRRKRLRDRPEAPAWPRRDPRRSARVIDLAGQLRADWPIERFVREMLLLSLEQRGQQLWARCPLPGHDDKTPSFAINPQKDVFFCHGCKRGGNIFRLIGFLRSLDRFADQVAVLAEVAGVPMVGEVRYVS